MVKKSHLAAFVVIVRMGGQGIGKRKGINGVLILSH